MVESGAWDLFLLRSGWTKTTLISSIPCLCLLERLQQKKKQKRKRSNTNPNTLTAILGCAKSCETIQPRSERHIVYVGRGDSNFLTRVIRSHRSGTMRYDRKVQIYRRSSPREAYRLECTLIHRYEPVDNSIHPAVPAGSNWRCPVKSCDWS